EVCAAVQTSEQVCSWSGRRAQRFQVSLDLIGRPPPDVAFVAKRFKGVGERHELWVSNSTQVAGSIAAVKEPVLLLPAGEAGRSPTDFLEDAGRNAGLNAGTDVSELGLEALCGAPIGDAPRAQPLDLFG